MGTDWKMDKGLGMGVKSVDRGKRNGMAKTSWSEICASVEKVIFNFDVFWEGGGGVCVSSEFSRDRRAEDIEREESSDSKIFHQMSVVEVRQIKEELSDF